MCNKHVENFSHHTALRPSKVEAGPTWTMHEYKCYPPFGVIAHYSLDWLMSSDITCFIDFESRYMISLLIISRDS